MRRGRRQCIGLLAALLAGCGALGPTLTQPPAHDPPDAAATIYLVRSTWHIDIGFATDELAAPLRTLGDRFPGARYLLFGFGDRRYLESRHRDTTNLLAALWPGAGLILMTALSASPAAAYGPADVIAIPISAAQARAAQAWVWSSLVRRQEVVQSDGTGPYEGSLYLRATADYSAMHTCNTWAAQALQAAGLPVRSAGVIFAGQLWRQARPLAPSASPQ